MTSEYPGRPKYSEDCRGWAPELSGGTPRDAIRIFVGRAKLCSVHDMGSESAPVPRSECRRRSVLAVLRRDCGQACARGDSAGTPDLDRGPRFWLLSRCYVLWRLSGKARDRGLWASPEGSESLGGGGEYYFRYTPT